MYGNFVDTHLWLFLSFFFIEFLVLENFLILRKLGGNSKNIYFFTSYFVKYLKEKIKSLKICIMASFFKTEDMRKFLQNNLKRKMETGKKQTIFFKSKTIFIY